ncbi:MAG: aminopeptidase [Candidatus Azobacteroides sp.]|nr:aminopeptidase [Candidatus Azobacteroides sp.]
MSRYLLSAFFSCLFIYAYAQEETNQTSGYSFTTVQEIPITSVKNQSSSGTCWSFSGLGLIEAELLREGKGEYDLSEMFVVHKNYEDKAKKYVRMHGANQFGGGGSFADVLDCIRYYGIVPDSIQPGLNYGEELHRHAELDSLLSAYVGVIIQNPNKKLSSSWFKGLNGILDAYLGECPESFSYRGKQYTPQSFAQSLGIRAEDYISITSFTHHPFYLPFPLEIPDNWRWAYSYNLPLNEMMRAIDTAIEKGYTVAWAADVSEKGFSRKGIGMVQDKNKAETAGSDQVRWIGEKENQTQKTAPLQEKIITQELRQEGFDNYETTDDHGMLIYGTAVDQNGNKYYMVKNSWGIDNSYKGTWYVSVSYVEYKTTSIVLNKNALPTDLKNKLKIN